MNITFFGNFSQATRKLFEEVAVARGHHIDNGELSPLMVVFMMAHDLDLVQEIAKKQPFVVVIFSFLLSRDEEEKFFRSGVYDSFICPQNQRDAGEIFLDLEIGLRRFKVFKKP